jgi:hypothetical protein
MKTPDRSTAAAFPRYLTGEMVADSLALKWQGLYARRWRLPRVVDRLLVPATPEPHISCNLRGMAEFQERDVGGAWITRRITGGGEPTLLKDILLQRLIAACAGTFEKVVLITNGHNLASEKVDQIAKLDGLYNAGLRVLALSRHHFDPERNRQIMHLDTPVESLIKTWHENRSRWPLLRLRLISVLQRGGVEDNVSLERYVSWAVAQGVEEICFKELYVSTSTESVYHDRAANDWSRLHQVPLRLITRFAETEGFAVESRLPWGAPVFSGTWAGKSLRIAAYTEPSLFWERTEGIARSWNVMADSRCHVSLEDRASEIQFEELP